MTKFSEQTSKTLIFGHFSPVVPPSGKNEFSPKNGLYNLQIVPLSTIMHKNQRKLMSGYQEKLLIERQTDRRTNVISKNPPLIGVPNSDQSRDSILTLIRA